MIKVVVELFVQTVSFVIIISGMKISSRVGIQDGCLDRDLMTLQNVLESA